MPHPPLVGPADRFPDVAALAAGVLFDRDPSLVNAQPTARADMADSALRHRGGRVGGLLWGLARSRPVPPAEFGTCTVVTTPDDPMVPESLAEESVAGAGVSAEQWYRLVYGGHFPQLVDDTHPVWGARNVHELVSLVDRALDRTRPAPAP